jgi:lysozyme family protein
MNFDVAVDLILKLEGGYVDDPRDSGGETKFGISKKAYPNEDIKNLTLQRAKEIYRADYWNPSGARVVDIAPKLALCVFDSAVNQGVSWASKALQGVLHVKQDGVIGPLTIAALNEAVKAFSENWVVAQFMAQRMIRYTQLSAWNTYAFGWSVRMFTVMLAIQPPAAQDDSARTRAIIAQLKKLVEEL